MAFLSRCFLRKLHSSSRLLCNQEFLSEKTTATILNKNLELGLMINAYSTFGFRLNNGMSVLGPIALFPKTVLSWKVTDIPDINENSLSLFYTLDPKIDLLILGLGDRGKSLPPHLYTYLVKKGISIEALSTEAACATFNFLNAEGRYIAAGLIPPSQVHYTENDYLEYQNETDNVFQSKFGSVLT